MHVLHLIFFYVEKITNPAIYSTTFSAKGDRKVKASISSIKSSVTLVKVTSSVSSKVLYCRTVEALILSNADVQLSIVIFSSGMQFVPLPV